MTGKLVNPVSVFSLSLSNAASSILQYFKQVADYNGLLWGARLHDDSKVICLDLTEIYWQGRGKEEEESGKEEQKVALQVWDEPIAG